MRIALATDTFLPEINGVTTVLGAMHRSLLTSGEQVLVIAPRSPGAAAEPGVVRRASVPCPGYPAIRVSSPFGRDVRRALGEFKPDLVHAVTEGPIGWKARGWALKRGIPLVTSFHTDFPRYAGRYLGTWAVKPVRRFLHRFHRPSRMIQTPSDATRRELTNQGLTQAVVWGRGVDSALFSPSRRSEARRSELLGRPDGIVLLHVGRLAVEKDMETLVGACRRAARALGDRVALVVAGDGPRSAWVREQLPMAVHRGFLGREELADLYADADLFVFPSPTETCGLVALEAMAAGLPVLSADVGGVLENVRHGLNGLLLPAGDVTGFAGAIVDLAQDHPRRQAMAASARAFAVARDWNREMEALADLYERVMTRAPALAPGLIRATAPAP